MNQLAERIQQAIDAAYRAKGFAEYLHRKGLIGKGNEVRSAVESLLTLETSAYPDFIRLIGLVRGISTGCEL